MAIGKLYIISAPSGAGKTSLVKKLISSLKQIAVSVSHTTRPMRQGETEGVDYFFSDLAIFKQMIKAQAFLEFAQVFDNYYGTSKKQVETLLNEGTDVILEIDWQGAQQIREKLNDSIFIFILPPSIEALRLRLENRGQDSEQVINRRMRDAINEISHYQQFDYLVVNDDFDQALTELKSIVICHRLNKQRQLKHLAPLLNNLLA